MWIGTRLALIWEFSMSRNTSQDPEYSGERGNEKKLHKTHWGVNKKLVLRKTKRLTHKWEEYAPGKFIRVKIERNNGEEENPN